MKHVPLRARVLSSGQALLVNDAGGFFAAGESFLDRLSAGLLTEQDREFLLAEGHAYEATDGFPYAAHVHAVAQRFARAGPLDYLILVPTLRCNLSCTYCQVSRAPADSPGFDWTDATLEAVLRLVDGLDTPTLKIEFQGGEPTLRPDLIKAVITRAERFRRREFVICTNLSRLDDEMLAIFDRPDVFISTSLDGDADVHRAHRTSSDVATKQFLANLSLCLDRYGAGKISALPTIDPAAPPDPNRLIDAYADRGLHSIYLRPINYQGFARKRHAGSREQDSAWRSYYEKFVLALIARNWSDRSRVLEETYLSICLRRVFRPGLDRHVDLRNPNAAGMDYIVVDHDGQVYPTDEARMLTRSGVIDLAIGDVQNGWDTPARDLLNENSTNLFDPACQRCAYQPYCGRDVIDDIARYGRVDLPRTETAFCRKHLHLFDFIFRLVYGGDEAAQYSIRRWLDLPGEAGQLAMSIQ